MGVAAVNGPGVGGACPVMGMSLGSWEAWGGGGVKVKRLRVTMRFILRGWMGCWRSSGGVGGLSFERPSIPIVSNVTGGLLSGEDVFRWVLGAACA